MKCENCGECIEDENRFCAHCGIQVRNSEIDSKSFCIRCVINLDKNLKFCPDCGAPIKSKIAEEDILSKKNALAKASAISTNPDELHRAQHSSEQEAGGLPLSNAKKVDPTNEEYKKCESEATSIFRSNKMPNPPLNPNNPDATPVKNYDTVKRISLIVGLAVLIGGIFFTLKPSINDQSTPFVTPTTAETTLSSESITVPHEGRSPSSESKAENPANIAVTPSQMSNESTESLTRQESPPSSPSANYSSQSLLKLAANGDWHSFQAGIKERKAPPTPPFGDRKLARNINEKAMDTLKTDTKRAVVLLTQAYSSDPSDEEIAVNLGLALRAAEDYKSSEEHLLRIIETWPDRAIIWFNLAQTLSLQGKKNKEAIGAFVGTYILSKNQEKTLSYYTRLSNDQEQHELLRTDVHSALNIIKLLKK